MAGFPCAIMPWWYATSGHNLIDLSIIYCVRNKGKAKTFWFVTEKKLQKQEE